MVQAEVNQSKNFQRKLSCGLGNDSRETTAGLEGTSELQVDGLLLCVLRCPFGRIPKRSVRCRAFDSNSDVLAAASIATTLRICRVKKRWVGMLIGRGCLNKPTDVTVHLVNITPASFPWTASTQLPSAYFHPIGIGCS